MAQREQGLEGECQDCGSVWNGNDADNEACQDCITKPICHWCGSDTIVFITQDTPPVMKYVKGKTVKITPAEIKQNQQVPGKALAEYFKNKRDALSE